MTEGTIFAAIDESVLHYRHPLNLYTATITPESILITRQLTPPLEGKTCLPPGFIQDWRSLGIMNSMSRQFILAYSHY